MAVYRTSGNDETASSNSSNTCWKKAEIIEENWPACRHFPNLMRAAEKLKNNQPVSKWSLIALEIRLHLITGLASCVRLATGELFEFQQK